MKVLALRMPFAAAILVAPFLASCGDTDTGGTAQPGVDTAAEAQAIMVLERAWSSKFGEGDIDWIMSIHSANAVQLPPGAELVAGEALRAAWQGMMDTDGLTASWEPTEAHVSTSGDMAYDIGTATLTTPDGNVQAMKYLVVWVREDGEWKVAVDMFNANEAPGM